jgi:phytoene dehydrogenase-like protein
MAANEKYDVVIVGAGHNGTTTAAYLAKCGLSVCLLEERPECGGAQENVEPIAGVRTAPHAVGNYAGAAPGWEQLELWKYGFRMDANPREAWQASQPSWEDARCFTTKGLPGLTKKDINGWAKLSGFLGQPPFTTELLRAVYYCPPHPPEVELTPENIPFMQVYKKHQPDVWTEELLEMTMFDLLDEYCETEPFKVDKAYKALMSGAFGHFQGQAIPALASVVAPAPPYMPRPVGPRGNMHGYYHAILRCAIAHGVTVRTCCPVDEIIVNNGTAVGVRLRETATCSEKTIWAKKAVISATDIRQTFLKLIGPQHLDAGFRQRIADLSLKGGSLTYYIVVTREPLRHPPKYEAGWAGIGVFVGGMGCFDSRELYFEHVTDVLGKKGMPTMSPDRVLWNHMATTIYDVTHPQCTRPGLWVEGPACVMFPTPEYQPDGHDAQYRKRAEILEYMRTVVRQYVENLNSDNVVAEFLETPYDQEFRNTGMLGGSWYGVRPCKDEWWNQRPLPELARYRAPIDGLYLGHQSSAHPGGLCIQAVAYNLMHTLIEDGIAEPGDWWYPSPWYIPQQGKKSARRP